MDCSWPGSSVMAFSRQEYWSGLPCLNLLIKSVLGIPMETFRSSAFLLAINVFLPLCLLEFFPFLSFFCFPLLSLFPLFSLFFCLLFLQPHVKILHTQVSSEELVFLLPLFATMTLLLPKQADENLRYLCSLTGLGKVYSAVCIVHVYSVGMCALWKVRFFIW